MNHKILEYSILSSSFDYLDIRATAKTRYITFDLYSTSDLYHSKNNILSLNLIVNEAQTPKVADFACLGS